MDKNFEKLAEIMIRDLKVPREKIVPQARLKDDLDADSLDASMVLMDIEEEFKVTVPEREREYKTVGDIFNHLNDLLKAKSASEDSAQSPGGQAKPKEPG
jgi:acyl carrier protein